MKKSENYKPTVYLIFGPTGAGKSDLISLIAQKRKISLISADSIQVYKGLDIGSAKPTKSEQEKFPHFLIDIRKPEETFSVADFITEAEKAICISLKKNLAPIISGGTAFYYKHFLYGLSKAPKGNDAIRSEIEDEINSKGLSAMYESLKEIDPVSYNRINPNDKYRIARAIEVYRISSKPLSSFPLNNKIRDDYKFVLVGILRDKEELKARIKTRLEKMFDLGLEKEVEGLKSKGLSLKNQSMNGIGYREFFLDLSLSKIKEQIYIDTVHYAKRQMTFFKSLANVKWIKF